MTFQVPDKTSRNNDEFKPDVNVIPFAPELINFILEDLKVTTYRFGKKYDYLRVGDMVNIQDSSSKQIVGWAKITGKTSTTFKELPLDNGIHESYRDKEHQRNVLSGYYAYIGRPIEDRDEFLVFDFKLVNKERALDKQRDSYTDSIQTKSGKQLFPIGIGTWNIAGKFELDPTAKYKGAEPVYGNEEAEIEALRYSISKGQNYIDCAELYGAFYTDEVVGRAIAGLQREDLYIADKLWKTSLGKGLVRPTVRKMLQKLGTDYLDLLYIHNAWDNWPEAVLQIDELIDEGIVRGLAVSNFTIFDMEEVQRIAKHPIVANQMNFNVLYRDEVTEEFKDFCKKHDIKIVAYQPLKRQQVLNNETVQAIASVHKATAAQVALAWLIQQDALPIPKATNKHHIDENIGAVDLRLSKEEVALLNSLAGKQR